MLCVSSQRKANRKGAVAVAIGGAFRIAVVVRTSVAWRQFGNRPVTELARSWLVQRRRAHQHVKCEVEDAKVRLRGGHTMVGCEMRISRPAQS